MVNLKALKTQQIKVSAEHCELFLPKVLQIVGFASVDSVFRNFGQLFTGLAQSDAPFPGHSLEYFH